MSHLKPTLIIALLSIPSACGSPDAEGRGSGADSGNCTELSDIEGPYSCSGECVMPGASQPVVEASGEVNTIAKFAGAKQNLFQVTITGGAGFRETEIGALVGDTMRTATSQVSDNAYPVLEEYIFEADDECRATSYRKVVRNPTPADFKACLITCEKNGN